jgi:hypothetical protein
MPTICDFQKSTELLKAKEWHLGGDGTTLNQQKKMAFLINGLVLGVNDVVDGSSYAALKCLKNELESIMKVFGKDDVIDQSILQRIISCTGDGASTQVKFNKLVEKEVEREDKIIENKCSMHLGVNLRCAQVKSLNAFTLSATNQEDFDSESDESDNDGSNLEEHSDDDDEQLDRDVDEFVREICKLFGHLGSPEYGHGAQTFRIFLLNEFKKTNEYYYQKASDIFLKHQVGNRYYVTSCNAGRVFYLRKSMVAFLNEQKMLKRFNLLEKVCLR